MDPYKCMVLTYKNALCEFLAAMTRRSTRAGSAIDDAKSWIKQNSDRPGLAKQFINEDIGK